MKLHEITLLRVTPILTDYSAKISDISSGSIYGIYIYIFVRFYLTFDILSGIYPYILFDILSLGHI